MSADRDVRDGSLETEDGASTPQLSRRRLRLGSLRDYAVLLALMLVFVVLSIASDPFLTTSNLLNVLEQSTGLGIIAVAGTLVLIAGGFDLSVGSVFALAGVVAAQLTNSVDPSVGIVVALLTATLIGMGNGLLVTVARINPFIATLATAILVRGLALLLTGGFLVNVSDEGFRWLGRTDVVGVKLSIWLWIAFAAVLWLLLRRTTLGRYIYATGGNEEAAVLSGIRVPLIRTITYALSGLAAGIAGVLSSSRVGTGQADAALGIELIAVAAIVVGGTSIRGGEGAVWRTLVGVLLIGLIGNGFNLLGLDPVYQDVVFGAIILVAAGVDARVRTSSLQ